MSGGTACTDINECASDDANNCPTEADCVNTNGGYDCVCPEDLYETIVYDGVTVCEFINECFEDTDNCDDLAICTHVDQVDPRYLCTCQTGYSGDGFNAESGGSGCVDTDECAIGQHQCSSVAICTNSDVVGDAPSCECPPGYSGDGYLPASGGTDCIDDDECAPGTANCPDNSICSNLPGDFSCSCTFGYEFNIDNTECIDINECDIENACGDENAICTNNEGGFDCECQNGFGARISCPDINECETNRDNCAEIATCENTIGSFECHCPDGYSTQDDGVTCIDNNECQDQTALCTANSSCINTDGGYECTCDDGYSGDGLVECFDNDECASDDTNNCPVESAVSYTHLTLPTNREV